ncbi:MAG: RNA polymerase sigma factor [Phycisphaerales bacterium]|nr:RNA polymerase sigma factor [Phycisphaerales bacterium]
MTATLDGDNSGGTSRASAGQWDRAQFAALFEESYRTLWLVGAGVLGTRQGVDDVLQEAAVVALGKADQFQTGTSFKAWMSQIVRFVAMNHGRRRRRDGAGSSSEALDQAAAPDAAAVPAAEVITRRGSLMPDQSAFDDEVTRALAELGETARACLLLRTVEGLEYAEISRVLGIPEGTAMSHVHRSRHAMRRRLTEWEHPPSSSRGARSAGP